MALSSSKTIKIFVGDKYSARTLFSPKYTLKKSSKNKYQSLTVKVEIDSAKSVVDIYAKTSSFKDVISL